MNPMAHSEDTSKELSMDELKEVSGGIRAQGGGYKSTSGTGVDKITNKTSPNNSYNNPEPGVSFSFSATLQDDTAQPDKK